MVYSVCVSVCREVWCSDADFGELATALAVDPYPVGSAEYKSVSHKSFLIKERFLALNRVWFGLELILVKI